jgi:peptidoglycan/LPS O-acetylase OafA/YrhL
MNGGSVLGFRADINGLRALAVLPVIFFHFNLNGFSGGFVGVDVFFVISGFLMTKIIFEASEKKTLSLTRFYLARANRIIPPLASLCLSLLLVGWFFLTPINYESLSLSIHQSMLFLSNFVYAKEAGYFDAGSHEQWLLHTWSLSVEWQFYLLYPLIIAISHKFFSLKVIKYLILFGAIAGFILSIYSTLKWPTPGYFLLKTRAWEMMFGGVAYLFPIVLKEAGKKWLEYSGLLLLFVSYIFISSGDIWPSFLTILPVLGAYAIIAADRQNSVISQNVVFQKIGKWSYSIYLWHWPIAVAGIYFHLNHFWALGIPTSILLGWLSYKFIESKKLPAHKWNEILSLKNPLLSYSLGAFILASLVYTTEGAKFEFREPFYDQRALYVEQFNSPQYVDRLHDTYADECNYYDYFTSEKHRVRDKISSSCVKIVASKKTILIWGDSHAQAIAQGIKTNKAFNYIQVASSGCKADIDQDINIKMKGLKKNACEKSNTHALKLLKEHKPELVILAQQDEHELTDFNLLTKQIKSYGVQQVLLIGPTPQWNQGLPKLISMEFSERHQKKIPIDTVKKSIRVTNDIMNLKAAANEFLYISLIDDLCGVQGCLVKVDDENTPLIFDYGHLTFEGSLHLYEKVVAKSISGALTHK